MLHADFETFSPVDLPKVGAHRYAVDPRTVPLCLGFSLGAGDPPRVVDLSEDPKPAALNPLFDRVLAGDPITAHNAEFERSVWAAMSKRFGWPRPKRSQFHCTAARARAAGWPGGLDAVCARLNLPVQKDPRGKDLLKRFAMPQKGGARILPRTDPEGFRALMAYCQQDVIAESAVDEALPALHPFERRAFLLDALINDRGFPVDVPLIEKALVAVDELTEEVTRRVSELTGGIAPTRRNAILAWLKEEGADIDTLQAQEIKDLVSSGTVSGELREVLELRLEASRAGLGKLKSMKACVNPDGRVRGMIMYYGAHTGRWSGQKVQPHNFARGDPEEQDRVLDILDKWGAGGLAMMYKSPLVALSESMRGFIAAPRGRRFIISDYSAIEARGLAYLARALEMLARYHRGLDLYVWMASRLYRVPESEVTSEQRRIGKNVILGCGYGLGAKTFVEYLARVGIVVTFAFAKLAVDTYREMNPEIVAYWKLIENAVKLAIRRRNQPVKVGPVVIVCDAYTLRIYLPSGRPIVYQEPFLEEEQTEWGPRDVIGFHTTYRGRWVTEYTYGGKLVENIVSGMARDLMVEGMINAEAGGYPVCLTVHDEIGGDIEDGQGSIDEFNRLVSVVPAWAQGMPLASKGFEAIRYHKD